MSKKDASLRPRRYSFAEHGNSSQGSRQGKHLIKNNAAQHESLCWGDGVTVIRPYPSRDPDAAPGTNPWDSYRQSSEPSDFSDWIRRYDAVRGFGDPGETFIIRDHSDPAAPDQYSTPAWVLFNAIDQAVNNGQEQPGWGALLKGGSNRRAVLGRPSEVYLIQGALMQQRQKVLDPPQGFAADAKPLVLEMSSNAGNALIAELNRLRENSSAQEGDWENLFANGDPVSLDTGRFITFYKLEDGDPRQRQQQQQQAAAWNTAQSSRMTAGSPQKPIGYGCFLEPTFNGMPAALRACEHLVSHKVQPWDDLLWFPTLDEQAHLLADKFPPGVLMYAWRDHPEWITETLRNRAVSSHSVNAPAGGWPQGMAGATPPQQSFGGVGQAQPPQAPPPQSFGGFGQAPPQQQAAPPAAGGYPAAFVPPAQPPFQAAGQPQFSPPQQFAPPQHQTVLEGVKYDPAAFSAAGQQPQQQFAPAMQPPAAPAFPSAGQQPQFQQPQFQQPQQQFAPPAGSPVGSLPSGQFPAATAALMTAPQLGWAGQNSVAPQSPMGQAAGGFAPLPPGMMPGVAAGPPATRAQQPDPAGQPMGRAAAALAAARQATAPQ